MTRWEFAAASLATVMISPFLSALLGYWLQFALINPDVLATMYREDGMSLADATARYASFNMNLGVAFVVNTALLGILAIPLNAIRWGLRGWQHVLVANSPSFLIGLLLLYRGSEAQQVGHVWWACNFLGVAILFASIRLLTRVLSHV